MWKVAIRGLLARKRRFITTTIGVVVGVAYLVATLIVGGVMRDSIDELIGTSLKGVDVAVRSPLVQRSGGGQVSRAALEGPVLEEVRAVDGVRVAEGTVEVPGLVLLGEDDSQVGGGFGPPTILYNWLEDDTLNGAVLAEGRGPTARDEVVIDYRTAEQGGFAVGDRIRYIALSGVGEATVVGIGGFSADGTRSGIQFASFVTEQAQELANFSGGYSFINVSAEEGVDDADLAERIRTEVDGVDALTGEAFTKERQDEVGEVVTFLRTFVQVFGYVALFVTAFVINNTFSIIGAQRMRETALLRAIGARRRQVVRAALGESLVIGVVAGVIGVGVGIGLAALLKSLIATSFALAPGFPRVGAWHLVQGVLVGLVVTVIAAVTPAWRAGRVPPIAALGEVAVDRADVARARQFTALGLVVVGLGLIGWGLSLVADPTAPFNPLYAVGAGAGVAFIALGVGAPVLVRPVVGLLGSIVARRGTTAVMARRNTTRNPRRSASSAIAVTIGVALVSLIAVLAASFRGTVAAVLEESFTVDLVVTAGFGPTTGLPVTVADDVRGLDGVASVTGLRFLPATVPLDPTEEPEPGVAPKGAPIFVAGVEADAVNVLIAIGEVEGDVTRLTDGAVAVSRQEAEEQGWRIGDRIPVWFAQVGLRELEVAAVFESEGILGGVLMDLARFEEVAPPGQIQDSFVLVRFGPDVDRDATRAEVEEAVSGIPIAEVQDVGELIEDRTAAIDALLALVYGLLALAVIIAMTGITSTLSLAVYERTRELGLLRAVGTRRKQLSSMIRIESVLICLFGAILGIVLGIVFAVIIARPLAAELDGFVTIIPWPTVAVILVVAVVAGILAAVLPARRAMRLDVLAAITKD